VSTKSEAVKILDEYIRRHDDCVGKGDFAPVASLFDLDAELVFMGVPLGPFHGPHAIRQAFCDHPPAGKLRIVSLDEKDRHAVRATFESGVGGKGSLTLTTRNGLIDRLIIDLR